MPGLQSPPSIHNINYAGIITLSLGVAMVANTNGLFVIIVNHTMPTDLKHTSEVFVQVQWTR